MSNNPFDRNKTKEARLGEVITDVGAQNQRDAVHIAVVPVLAPYGLNPGQHIGVTPDGTKANADCDKEKYVGIVDPFLRERVKKGQTFWLFLYQGHVTTLRHEWTHPAFPPVQAPQQAAPARDTSEALAWLQNYAEEQDIDLDTLLSFAKSYLGEGETNCHPKDSGKWEGESLHPDFWKYFERYTGIPVDDRDGSFFSCSC